MPRFVRVRDTSTGYEFDAAPEAVSDGVELLNSPEYPDLHAVYDTPRPPVYPPAKPPKASRDQKES